MSSPAARTELEREWIEEPPPSGAAQERVAALAYRLWQERGCPDGSPEVDWFQAEQLLSDE